MSEERRNGCEIYPRLRQKGSGVNGLLSIAISPKPPNPHCRFPHGSHSTVTGSYWTERMVLLSESHT